MTDPGVKSAIVTGAASGLGLGIATLAARRGYAVTLTDWHADRLADATQGLRSAGHRVQGITADVADYDQVSAVVTATNEEFGRIDLLVNNAGVESTGYLWETNPSRWSQVLAVNTVGVFNGMRAALPFMLTQSGEPATIVNIASLAAMASGPPRQSAYNASKHAVLAATECVRLELDEVGSDIAVHAVLPGPVASRIFTDALAEGRTAGDVQAQLDRFVTESGMTGDEAAEIVFAGIDAGDFWITTHPDMFATFAARRGELLRSRLAPKAVPVAVKVDGIHDNE